MVFAIRPPQITAFEHYATSSIRSQLVAHLALAVPDHVRGLDHPARIAAVEHGMSRASARGLRSAQAQAIWLTLMALLGVRFDDDPIWRQCLDNRFQAPPWTDGLDHAKRLAATALERLDQIEGLRNEHLQVALERAAALPLLSIRCPPSTPFEDHVLHHLRSLHPTKAAAAGPRALRELAALGRLRAARHGLGVGQGASLYVGLMFMDGAYFDEDPLSRWAARAVAGLRSLPEPQRAPRLHRRIEAHLRGAR